ncbi:hypothetical protein GCM10027275_37340 [Rhabdobacter roseus]|uniref:Uncharacterized protein n=1 Tax=Rhabdobacter roseus TaxID=1655419 RepID=A0A840U0F1_9BACT|nr:hypothetical protein [Rhabdobacter roseus]MBB5285858.1 hypothetical protein [Rhabdobacter roseus]
MFAGLFDVKNDRRLSMYLYRLGFGMWLLYLVLGAPMLASFSHYRQDAGVLSVVLMVVGFSASMVFEYFHHPALYEQKKKYLLISYLFLAGVIYFLEFKEKGLQLDWTAVLRWFS